MMPLVRCGVARLCFVGCALMTIASVVDADMSGIFDAHTLTDVNFEESTARGLWLLAFYAPVSVV